ncbi:MAG TPA: MerR family DNA-binding transcriptional regulator [Steroidobacteraceae bacterium]|nr:MerR family DNA-binding transcriptional regulator [Steroidobacteraceae bacterium]
MRKIRMKKFCAMSDLSPSTVRTYVARGLIADAERDSNGHLLFGEQAPEQARQARAVRLVRKATFAAA